MLTNEIATVLYAVRKRLEPRGAWCQLALATDEYKNCTSPYSTYATAWCISGAVTKETVLCDETNTVKSWLEFALNMRRSHHIDLIAFNDAKHRRKGEILALIDTAIKILGE